jgi:hypothetical protein
MKFLLLMEKIGKYSFAPAIGTFSGGSEKLSPILPKQRIHCQAKPRDPKKRLGTLLFNCNKIMISSLRGWNAAAGIIGC